MHRHVHEFALYLGGNDVAVRFNGDATDTDDPDQLVRLLTTLGKASMDPAEAMQIVADGSRADREVAGRMVTRLGLDEDVSGESVRHIFERWDGKGLPNGVAGDDLPLSARISHVASVAVMFAQARGPRVALATLGHWSGRSLDPAITEAFLAHADELLALLDVPDVWQAVLQ